MKLLHIGIVLLILFTYQLCLGQTKNEPSQKKVFPDETEQGKTPEGYLLNPYQPELMHPSLTGTTLELAKQQIEEITNVRDTLDPSNSSDVSRYIFTSPAFTINEDELALNINTLGGYTNLTYGVTDRFSVELGTSILGLAVNTPVHAITPKVHIINRKSFHLGASLSYLIDIDSEKNFAFLTVNSTFGNRYQNLSVGVGYDLANARLTDAPLVQVSGTSYLSERTSLVLDTQFVPVLRYSFSENTTAFNIMAAVRLRKNHHSWDVGLFIPGFIEDREEFIATFLPYFAYNVDLTRNR